jgi:hypothetical protein
MKKIVSFLSLFALIGLAFPTSASAAGVSVTGGGTGKYVGDEVSVSVTATGASFNAFSGTISLSGTAKISSCTFGDALWAPSKPDCTGSFNGAITGSATSFRVATVKIKGTSVGSAKVTVSNVKLVNNGTVVGTDGGSVSVDFDRRPTPPGAITVTSQSHPDQNTFYEVTTITLNWDKPTGVTGFSYLLDQTEGTEPPAKTTDTNTSATYESQPVGTYYFHIRAINGDGWGTTTTYKINIKEPDPKIQDVLAKPSNITVSKGAPFINSPLEGTLSGVLIGGITEPNFTANIKLEPAPTIPEGKTLSIKADETGKFQLLVDFPLKAGYYTLAVQGQSDKILTPVSDITYFEISVAKGGIINILTKEDTDEPVIQVPVKKWYEKINYFILSISLASILLLLAGILAFLAIKNKKKFKNLAQDIMSHKSLR